MPNLLSRVALSGHPVSQFTGDGEHSLFIPTKALTCCLLLPVNDYQ